MTVPLQFAPLYGGQEVFVWSDCLLDLGTDFLGFVWNPPVIRSTAVLQLGSPNLILCG